MKTEFKTRRSINCLSGSSHWTVTLFPGRWATTPEEIEYEQEWRSGESTRLPPMKPGSNSGVDAMCELDLLLVFSFDLRGFCPGTTVSPLLKNQPFQIPIQSGTHGHVSTSSHELLSAPWVKQLQLQWQLQIKRSSVQNPSDSKKFKTYLKDSYCSNYKSWN